MQIFSNIWRYLNGKIVTSALERYLPITNMNLNKIKQNKNMTADCSAFLIETGKHHTVRLNFSVVTLFCHF